VVEQDEPLPRGEAELRTKTKKKAVTCHNVGKTAEELKGGGDKWGPI